MTENKIDVIERNENPINQIIWLGRLLSEPKLARIYHSINIGGEGEDSATSEKEIIQETGLSENTVSSAVEKLIEIDSIRDRNDLYKTNYLFLQVNPNNTHTNSDYIISQETIGFFGKQFDNTKLREIINKYGRNYIHEIAHYYTTVKQEEDSYPEYVSSISKLNEKEASVIDLIMAETIKELDENTLYDLPAGGIEPSEI